MRIGISALVVLVGLASASRVEARRDKGPKLVGVKIVKTIEPSNGFIDDPFLMDRAGKRLAYVITDSGNLVKLRIATVANGVTTHTFDISKFAKIPKRLEFVLNGSYLFLLWKNQGNGPFYAGLINHKGKLLRKFGPAKAIKLHKYKGVPVVVLYTAGKRRHVRRGLKFYHTVELRYLRNGRRVKKTSLYVNSAGKNPKMEFRLVYWAKNYTYAVGIKGGGVDSKVSIRNPDVEGWYHMPTRKFHHKYTIKDLMKHKRKLRVKKQHQNQERFMDVSHDRTKLRFWSGDKVRVVRLAEKFSHYDYSSLRYQIGKHRVFFTLKIEPNNYDAVARKVADPEYLDLYEYTFGGTRAKRRARLLLPTKRKHWWFASSRHWVVVPRHIGFDRGGKQLRIYRLK